MANLKINLPLQTGDAEHDFNELYSWANRLVTELRTLMYALDSSNIRSLDTSKLTGSIGTERLTGKGITLTDADTGSEARIYLEGGVLNIEAPGVAVNGEEIAMRNS